MLRYLNHIFHGQGVMNSCPYFSLLVCDATCFLSVILSGTNLSGDVLIRDKYLMKADRHFTNYVHTSCMLIEYVQSSNILTSGPL
jgi:hypothetical protein